MTTTRGNSPDRPTDQTLLTSIRPLRAMRSASGLSAHHLAVKAKLSDGALWRLENGGMLPTLTAAERIAGMLKAHGVEASGGLVQLTSMKEMLDAQRMAAEAGQPGPVDHGHRLEQLDTLLTALRRAGDSRITEIATELEALLAIALGEEEAAAKRARVATRRSCDSACPGGAPWAAQRTQQPASGTAGQGRPGRLRPRAAGEPPVATALDLSVGTVRSRSSP